MEVNILTTASNVKWYIDWASKSRGPTRNMVPSVFSAETRRWRIAKSGDPCDKTVKENILSLFQIPFIKKLHALDHLYNNISGFY